MTEHTTITETKDGVTVNVKTKRGTGTRDQDTVSITSHYDNLQEAHADENRLVNLARKHAYRLRDIQPETPESDDE